MHAALAHGEAAPALALLERGGHLTSRKSEPLPVGDAIDLASPRLRGALLEADETRRRKNKLAGRDPDDGGVYELPRTLGDREPPGQHWPGPPYSYDQIMIPTRPYPIRVERPDRSGYLGYFGDVGDLKDISDSMQYAKQTFLAVQQP